MWSNLVNNPRRGTFVLGLFILTLGAGALALPSLGRLDLRGVSILDIELMRTSENAAQQVALLGPSGVDAAQMSIYLDFPFLVLYALALSAACAVLAARAADRGAAALAATGSLMVWAAPIAAALDAVENVALLRVLDGHTAQPWPGIAYGFASVKFALLALVVAYLIAGLVLVRRHQPVETPVAT
jgi:hypothetical protein